MTGFALRPIVFWYTESLLNHHPAAVEILNSINQSYSGLQIQQQRLGRNVAQVANVEAASGRDARTQDRALVEQGEIVNSMRANARSLQAAGERIGTLLDIKV